jgi:nicotine blue oxidoreductase
VRAAALVAAAGVSVRMGFPKALLAFPDNTLLLAQHVSVLRACGVDPVLVTLPPPLLLPDRDRLEGLLRAHGGLLMENRFMERGLLGSVQTALAGMEADACLLLPVDTPGVTRGLVEALMVHARQHPGRFVRPRAGLATGHPLVIPAHAFALIRDFRGDGGVRALLKNVVDLPWPDARVCTDVDTPEDAAAQVPPLRRWQP